MTHCRASLAKLGFPHEAAVGQPDRIPGLSGRWAAHRCGRAGQLSITATSFIVDVGIFAVLQLVLSRLVPSQVVLGAVGLASTFVALLLTNLISSGLAIKGVGTWILATLIVWVVTMLATWALSRWIRPNRAAPHRIR